MLKRIVHSLGRAYIEQINKSEAAAQKFTRHNERPIEFRFLFDCIARLRPISVLDVGSGTTALPNLMATCGCTVTAMDNVRDYWPAGMINRHWQVIDDDIREPRIKGPFDMVTCISVIEHIHEHAAAFRSMIRLLKPGGHLVLTTPYNERRAVPNVYDLPNSAYGRGLPYICRSTSRMELDGWLRDSAASIVQQQFWDFWTGEVWTQGSILLEARPVAPDERHQLTCLLIGKPA